jgi:hypothetical protein
MTAMRPERPSGGRPNGDARPADAASFEGEIREFIRRDVAPMRRLPQAAQVSPPANNEASAEQVNALVARVAGMSMEEIDRVILELQGVRDMLRTEGERVSRDIASYASLSHAAMTSMRVIADSLAQWKNGAKLHPEGR